jgi:glycosyltransferase involved in cell wall biosynthesis
VIRVLVDGRVQGSDGIGRYTRCTIAALRAAAPAGIHIEVLAPTGTRRYSRAEGDEVLRAADAVGADVIHLLDFRVPLAADRPPVISTVHDVLRLRAEHCYTDDVFGRRFGVGSLDDLDGALGLLRTVTSDVPVAADDSRHSEYCARMLTWAATSSSRLVTPTHSVASQLGQAISGAVPATVSPWGIDHQAVEPAPQEAEPASRSPELPDRYLLYVGQTRPHKQLPLLIEAFLRSHAARLGVALVCAGNDFEFGGAGTPILADQLGSAGLAAGFVPDTALVQLYRDAVALLHVAEHEGFGFTPLEALAAGTQVIASDIPVLRETLGANALFVDHTNPEEIAVAINRVLTEKEMHTPTAREQRILWTRRFRWHRHATELFALYEGAIS